MITTIEISGEKNKAKFIKRLNRFEALAECGGETVLCHVANTGRMKELLVTGRDVVLRRAKNPDRKTKWDLIIAYTIDGVPVFLESVMANRLILKALKEGKLKEFQGWTDINGRRLTETVGSTYVSPTADLEAMELFLRSLAVSWK